MIVVVTGRGRPHEQLLFGVSVLLGISYLVRVPAPQTLTAAVPRAVVLLWAAGLAVSGVVGLVGCLWRGNVVTGLGIERGGLVMSTAALALIGTVVVAETGWRGVFTAAIVIAWAIAHLLRCVQITRDLRQVAAAQGEVPGV